MSNHEQILEMLERPWIDLGGGRRALDPGKLPPHAHEPSPCMLVELKAGERLPEEVSTAATGKLHPHPHFGWHQIPTPLAWIAIDPGERSFAICRWMNWDAHTVTMLREFCEQTGRASGRLRADRTVDFGETSRPFSEFRLIHEDELKPQKLTVKKTAAAARKVAATAQTLLKSGKPAVKELEHEAFQSDAAAHDDALHAKLRRQFVRRLQGLEKELTAELGKPDSTGTDDGGRLPLGGVFRYALWEAGSVELFLAAHHEDRELPYILSLGVRAKG